MNPQVGSVVGANQLPGINTGNFIVQSNINGVVTLLPAQLVFGRLGCARVQVGGRIIDNRLATIMAQLMRRNTAVPVTFQFVNGGFVAVQQPTPQVGMVVSGAVLPGTPVGNFIVYQINPNGQVVYVPANTAVLRVLGLTAVRIGQVINVFNFATHISRWLVRTRFTPTTVCFINGRYRRYVQPGRSRPTMFSPIPGRRGSTHYVTRGGHLGTRGPVTRNVSGRMAPKSTPGFVGMGFSRDAIRGGRSGAPFPQMRGSPGGHGHMDGGVRFGGRVGRGRF